LVVRLSLRGENGDTIDFDGSVYIARTGIAGFSIPQAEVRIDQSAADGGVFRHARRAVRTVDIPISVVGDSRSAVEDSLRRVSRLLQAGSVTVVAVYEDGYSWELTGYYVGGAEGSRGEDENDLFANWVLTLQCPDPYWKSQTTEQIILTNAGFSGRSLIPDLAELRISSSNVIGNATINNTGDVEALPTVTFKGDIDTLEITTSDGRGWSFDETILSTETITVDSVNGTVVDATGANHYGSLGPSPKMLRFPSGTSDLAVVATGATSSTVITIAWQIRKEVLH
jgi:phage-related protein